MKYYNLDEDEVPLYKGKVILKNANGETNLILTNKKFVFINITKNEQGIEVISNVEYPVHEVKEYKGKYQVLKKGNVVEIYFLHNEMEFAFEKHSECQKFMNEAIKLLTGKNLFERGAEKFFKGKECVDNSLHIDSSAIVKKTANLFASKKTINLSFGKRKNG